ncbi:MAG: tyrosinase [Candidatus Eremiobacteraeota bacterium]|jgi:tyrosinase|nr:tyrosinase [Candidatus Eremiobacteraeota bacterium]
MAVLTAVAPERETFIAPNPVRGATTIRKSVYAMSDVEVTAYRLAVYRLAQISEQAVHDQRGYQYVAGIHGLPGRFCKHHVAGFALWHRPYMQGYEQRLQDVVPGTFVPYWDWSTRRAQREGIPQIFLDETWQNPDTNQEEANPLLSQPTTLVRGGGGPTTRDPQGPSGLIELRADLQTALLAPDYNTFSPDLENPHDSVHGWVGGSMSNIGTAAYDPLFWSHHAFIEYAFCQWQDSHTEAQPPFMDPRDLAPFSVTVEQIWNYEKLGYTYEPDNATELQIAGVSNGPGAAAGYTLRSGATVASFPLHTVDPDEFHRAELRFENLTPPEDTFAVRVFADERGASAATPTNGNPHYLGTRYFFGHGECGGAEGHCDPVARDIYDLRPRHHYAPVRVRLNITKRLRALIRDSGGPQKAVGSGDAPITLVVVDRDGNEVEDCGLHFEGLSVVIR